MRLLNTLWRQRVNFLVIALSLVISLLTITPVIKGGVDQVFYSIDPDVVYVANALLYIKSGYVSYFDHPGTPAIILISLFLIPLRIYAKFFQHTLFIDWVFNHYASTFFYLRITQSILLFSSLLTLSAAMRILTKKVAPVILFFLTLLSFSPFYGLGSTISAETFTFFIVSIWLLLLSLYLTRKDSRFLFLLTLSAGVAFAGRATNFFLLPASLLIAFNKGGGVVKKILFVIPYIAVMIVGFVAGVSPTRTHLSSILKLIFGFANSTGVHLSGEKTLFSYQYFVNSINILFHNNTLSVIIIVISSILAIGYLSRKEKTHRKIAFIILIFLFGAVVFAKLPLAHYQTTNFLVITFFGTIFFSRLPKMVVITTAILLSILILPISNGFLVQTTQKTGQSGIIEHFLKNNPPKYASVWSWAQTKEFAYLWNRNYADGMFDDQLTQLNPGIYGLSDDITKIQISKYTQKNIFEVCWDELYIQDSLLMPLLEIYPNLSKSVYIIGDTRMHLVRSSHCNLNPI